MSGQTADVMAVLSVSEQRFAHSYNKARREWEKKSAAGKPIYDELQLALERSEYLRDEARAATAAVAKLINVAHGACEFGWSDTAARELRAALADVGGMK